MPLRAEPMRIEPAAVVREDAGELRKREADMEAVFGANTPPQLSFVVYKACGRLGFARSRRGGVR